MEKVTSAKSSITESTGQPDICIIGAGNVATHLAMALSEVAHVRQIVSRHTDSASRLAQKVGRGCLASVSLDGIISDADFYLIAVNDDSIEDIAASTPDFPGIWAHTSGSVPMDVFAGRKSRYGVFYPLQTFTRDLPVDIAEVPFFIEGSAPDVAGALTRLASLISHSVHPADSVRRKALHVAAVFACNFANLMWMEADEILKQNGLTVNCFMPLLKATLAKLNVTSPELAMTGPARRGDTAVINVHKNMLPPDKREIYSLLSDAILKKFHPETLSRSHE